MGLVQSTTGTMAGTSSSTKTLTGVVSGNALICVVSYLIPNTSDGPLHVKEGTTAYNADSFPTPVTSADGLIGAAIFSLLNVAAGSHTVTITPNANAMYAEYSLLEYSGLVASPAVDQVSSGGSGTGGSGVVAGSTGSSPGTTWTSELIIAALAIEASTGATNAGISTPATSGYTSLNAVQNTSTNVGTEHSYKTVAGAGSQSAAWTWSSDTSLSGWQAALATYKLTGGTAAGGGGPINFRTASNGGMQSQSGGMRG